MRIKKAQHKAILNSLFYTKTEQVVDGNAIYNPKQLPFEKLGIATRAAEKLNKGTSVKNNRILYEDGEIELTLEETTLLKELFDGNKDNWTVVEGKSVEELQELFEGKEGK